MCRLHYSGMRPFFAAQRFWRSEHFSQHNGATQIGRAAQTRPFFDRARRRSYGFGRDRLLKLLEPFGEQFVPLPFELGSLLRQLLLLLRHLLLSGSHLGRHLQQLCEW